MGSDGGSRNVFYGHSGREWVGRHMNIYIFSKNGSLAFNRTWQYEKKVVPHQPFELTRLIRNSRINECLRVAVPYNRITLVCVCVVDLDGRRRWRFIISMIRQYGDFLLIFSWRKMRITWVIWCCVACGLQVKKSIIKAKKKWKKRRIVEWRSKMFCVLSNPMKVEKPSW